MKVTYSFKKRYPSNDLKFDRKMYQFLCLNAAICRFFCESLKNLDPIIFFINRRYVCLELWAPRCLDRQSSVNLVDVLHTLLSIASDEVGAWSPSLRGIVGAALCAAVCGAPAPNLVVAVAVAVAVLGCRSGCSGGSGFVAVFWRGRMSGIRLHFGAYIGGIGSLLSVERPRPISLWLWLWRWLY